MDRVTREHIGLRELQNNKALKQISLKVFQCVSLRELQNNKALKQ